MVDRSNLDFRELVELAGDAIIARTAGGEILFWNAGAERLYGWSAGEAVGRSSHQLLATEFPQPLADIHATLAQEGRWEGALRHRTAAGAELIVLSRWVQQPGRDDIILEINRDETARKAVEEALTASRARFDFVVDSAAIGLFSCDLPFDELIWNTTCKTHFGLPADARVTIDTFYDRMHPDDVERTRRAISDAIDHGVQYDVEYRTRQPNDAYRWIRAVGRAEYDDRGEPRRFEGATFDVTETRRASERFRELADSLPQVVWSADAQGRVDYLNRRWYELTGRTPGDLDTGGIIHPLDADAAQEAFQQSVATGAPYQHEFRLCLPGAPEPRWFLGRALPMHDDTGHGTRWYATSTDIDEQKRVEQQLVDSRDRLRAALDASNTGTFRWTISSGALDWDDNLDRLFGLEPGTSVHSLQHFLDRVHLDDRERVMAACDRSATAGADFCEEFRVVWPDGRIRWLFDKGRVYTAADGTRYMTGACLDVTERRNQEDALRAADRQKDEFLGMLAHEIRNPLAPIMYSASLLAQKIDDPTLRRPLDIIRRQVDRMIRIVDDLLDVSRVTQGKISLQLEEVPVSTALSQCIENQRLVIQTRGHVVTLHPSDRTVCVRADAVRLAQVIENLLVNAFKYTPPGGQVDVSATATDVEVAIRVKDSGIGISADMLGRVFDLFAQADTSLHRSEGGLGIGLTLAQRLAELHGGRIEAGSDGLGAGSTFTLTLPRAVGSIVEAPQADARAISAVRLRVLIVDDNRDAAEMLKALIEQGGHDTRLVHHGDDALEAAVEFEPNLVLLDIGLPGKDGYDVLREVRSRCRQSGVRIVATTGYGREKDRARCLDAGFDDHTTKPIPSEVLTALLAACIPAAAAEHSTLEPTAEW